MKKKILIIVAVVVVLVGGTVAVLALTGGGATEEDHAQGDTSDEDLSGEGGALENPENNEMPESNLDDAAADSLEEALGIDEEFDPNDI